MYNLLDGGDLCVRGCRAATCGKSGTVNGAMWRSGVWEKFFEVKA